MEGERMRVLVACEFSGRVRDAFRKLGHDAWSCDMLPTESDPRWHIQGDAREVVRSRRWDALIHHTPCTFATNAATRWLYVGGRGTVRDERRWRDMEAGAAFFRDMQSADVPLIAGENPIPHRYALALMGPYSQIIQPWMFGHPEKKATCLWLKGLPPLVETNNVRHLLDTLPKSQTDRVHRAPPSPDRWKERSRTLPGIASAMAEQWGRYG